MKNLLIIILIFWAMQSKAQNIVKMEYWVDNDPGFGLATNITGYAQSSNISNFIFNVPAILPLGAHLIGIRTLNTSGIWSHTNMFFVHIADSSKGAITKMEYFWDTDPGFNKGTQQILDVPSSNLKGGVLKVAVPYSLPLGSHNLFVRSVDNRGRWSHTNLVGQVELLPLTNDTIFVDTTVCSSFITPKGIALTKTGIYNDAKLVNGTKYQIVIYDLKIKPVDISVSQNGTTLSANAMGAAYKWVDCNSSYQLISGETSRTFTATKAGNYAVIIGENGCTDTSICYQVVSVNVPQLPNTVNSVTVFPNPTNGTFTIRVIPELEAKAQLIITDIVGKIITQYPITEQTSEISINEPSGVYFARITNGENNYVIKIIINK